MSIVQIARLLVTCVLFIGFLLSISSVKASHNYVSKNNILVTSTTRNDEFDSPSLNANWTWYNEDPSRWSLAASPGNLRIIGTRGDMATTCNNPVNILLQRTASKNFEITIKLSLDPRTNYQQGGIIILNNKNGEPDLENYVKTNILYNSDFGTNGMYAEFLGERQSVFPPFPWPHLAVQQTQPAYLKMTRFGSNYNGYYSIDGKVWTAIGSQMVDTINDAFIGVYALSGVIALPTPQCNQTYPDTIVDFDYFRYSDLSLYLPFVKR